MWGTGFITWIENKINPDRIANKSRSQILAQYGSPDATYQINYCMIWQVQQDFPWFPKKAFLVNKDFQKKLFEAFTELQAEGLHTEIKTFDGCYNLRNTRDSSLPSLHSWAMALDINAAIEKLGQKTTNWSDRFIEIMTAHVYWGGQFISRKDPMHFSLFNE